MKIYDNGNEAMEIKLFNPRKTNTSKGQLYPKVRLINEYNATKTFRLIFDDSNLDKEYLLFISVNKSIKEWIKKVSESNAPIKKLDSSCYIVENMKNDNNIKLVVFLDTNMKKHEHFLETYIQLNGTTIATSQFKVKLSFLEKVQIFLMKGGKDNE